MPKDIKIPDEKLKYLSEPARDELVTVTETYVEDILREAFRLDIDNSSNRDPDINRSMIDDADQWIRKAYVRRKKPWWFIVLQIAAAIFGLITGYLFNSQFLQNPLLFIIFIICLTVTISSTIVVMFIPRE